jgi:hypothetical protein
MEHIQFTTKGVEVDETGKLPYEAMDKADNLDHSWFTGDGYTARGKEVIAAIQAYKADMTAALGNEKKYAAILNEVTKKFDLTEVKDKEGVKIEYLDYHFKGFPAIASLAIDPLPIGVKKLSGFAYTHRIRVGNYRVIYELHGHELTVTVLKVAHRKDVYR